MSSSNVTLPSEFIIVGVAGLQKHYTALFIIFFILFLATFLGNLLILVLMAMDHQLHTLRYFFLWNFALLDISSFPRCLQCFYTMTELSHRLFIQMYFIISLGAAKLFLVAVIVYDQCVAVVKPLHYDTIMSPRVHITMTSSSIFSFLMISIYVPFMFILWYYFRIVWSVIKMKTVESHKKAFSICSSHMTVVFLYYVSTAMVYIGMRVESIPSDGCIFVVPTVMSLACGDVTAQVNFSLFLAMVVIYIPFLFVLWSYYRIVWSVIKMKTLESRKKAFSMCSSHVTVVFLYYASAVVVYIGLRVESISPDGRIFIGGMNYSLTPLVNPIIYSLRNEKIKAAPHRYLRLQSFFHYSANNSVNTTK
ncbi:OLF15 protein, partial [Atractosteus spatula]|nr:OLF15 protein [Atractosteus spatula]